MRPVFVGLAGGTASGKTTLSARLVERYGSACARISHDAYYRSLPKAYRSCPESYNFDHPDALETDRLVRDVERLSRGESVEVPRYDFATHLRRPASEWRRVDAKPLILVEGILILAVPRLRERLDGIVFVRASQDVRLARRLRRDVDQRGRLEADVRAQFAATVAPMHEQFVEPFADRADVIVDGEACVEDSLATIEAYLSGLLGRGL